jgi:protein O-mannosyl-transferase
VVAAAILMLAVGGYAGATWQRASLWGDEDRLLLVWAETNPYSARAQVSAAQIWLRRGRPADALAQLEAANERIPDNGLLIGNRLAFRAGLGLLSLDDFEAGARQIRQVHFDPQSTKALELLVDVLNSRPDPDRARVLNDLLRDVRLDLNRTIPTVHHMTLVLQGRLLAGQGRPHEAMPYFEDALEYSRNVDSGLRTVSDLAILGYYAEAWTLLDATEVMLAARDDKDLQRPREIFESDIAGLRAALLEDMELQRPTPEPRKLEHDYVE